MSKIMSKSKTITSNLASYDYDQKDRSDASMSGSCKKEDVIQKGSFSYLSVPPPPECKELKPILASLSSCSSSSSSTSQDNHQFASSSRQNSVDSLVITAVIKEFPQITESLITNGAKEEQKSPSKKGSRLSSKSAGVPRVPSRELRQGCSKMTRTKSQLSVAKSRLDYETCDYTPKSHVGFPERLDPRLFDYPVHSLCASCLKNYKRKEQQIVLQIQTERERMALLKEIDRFRRRKQVRSKEKLALLVILLVNAAFFVAFCFLGLLFLKAAHPP